MTHTLETFEQSLPGYRERGIAPYEAIYTPEDVARIVEAAEARAMERAATIAESAKPPSYDFEDYPQWGSYPQYDIADKIRKAASK